MSNREVAELFNVRSHNPSFFAVQQTVASPRKLLDFCIPVNLYFPPPELLALVRENLPDILRYYPDYVDVHQKHLGQITGLPSNTIIPCNGSTEIITKLCQMAKAPIVTSIPTFSRWTDLPEELAVPFHTIQRNRDKRFRLEAEEIVEVVRNVQAATLVISNPNNPTGAWMTHREVRTLVELPASVSGKELRDRLLVKHGVMARECSNKIGSSEQYLRLAVQTNEAVDVLVAALREELE
ncbi:MAG TPA: aminotransferase class I/II-fold pyridoxal phosphate-dependent enzyme [Pyrinomonadaceae bacterium]|nr:aminotransferase class I/II-fold pyridoxal phosphate-dependent enzyme [Pyrinomonadaceae bacterium]